MRYWYSSRYLLKNIIPLSGRKVKKNPSNLPKFSCWLVGKLGESLDISGGFAYNSKAVTLGDCKMLQIWVCRSDGTDQNRVGWLLIRHASRATFPHKGRLSWCVFRSPKTKNTLIYISFWITKNTKSLAFPAGEGADQLLRREADEGGSRHRLFRQTADRKTAIFTKNKYQCTYPSLKKNRITFLLYRSGLRPTRIEKKM